MLRKNQFVRQQGFHFLHIYVCLCVHRHAHMKHIHVYIYVCCICNYSLSIRSFRFTLNILKFPLSPNGTKQTKQKSHPPSATTRSYKEMSILLVSMSSPTPFWLVPPILQQNGSYSKISMISKSVDQMDILKYSPFEECKILNLPTFQFGMREANFFGM